MGKLQQKYDVILSPTLATPPIKHGEITLTGWAQEVVDGLLKFIPSTPLANWTGQPAMTVPLHLTKDGLPIGMQFMGRFCVGVRGGFDWHRAVVHRQDRCFAAVRFPQFDGLRLARAAGSVLHVCGRSD